MRVILICLVLVGCNHKIGVNGGTVHHVYGEVKVVNEIVLKLDVSACDTLAGEAQASCITETVKAMGDLAELAKSLACKDQECLMGGK